MNKFVYSYSYPSYYIVATKVNINFGKFWSTVQSCFLAYVIDHTTGFWLELVREHHSAKTDCMWCLQLSVLATWWMRWTYLLSSSKGNYKQSIPIRRWIVINCRVLPVRRSNLGSERQFLKALLGPFNLPKDNAVIWTYHSHIRKHTSAFICSASAPWISPTRYPIAIRGELSDQRVWLEAFHFSNSVAFQWPKLPS